MNLTTEVDSRDQDLPQEDSQGQGSPQEDSRAQDLSPVGYKPPEPQALQQMAHPSA